MNRITRRIVLALLVIALAGSCSKQDAITGSETRPNEVAASQATAQPGAQGSRKVKYYKSTMVDETSKIPGKDSMGMDMVPVYEGGEDTLATPVDQGKKPIEAAASRATAQSAAAGSRKIKYYKSGMMLGEISKTPRKDSMGMDMVPVYEGNDDTSAISIDPVTIQVMGVRTAKVTRGPLNRVIRTVGVIDYNETALADVTTKFRGWIEKLYVDSTGKEVRKGEPLFDIYSPDLYSAQNEYVLALAQGASGLRSSARLKLALFDISDDQIVELEQTRKPQRTLRINAPIDGIVVEKMAVQGQMVEAGMKLYRLADLSIVWVQAQVYEEDLAFLKLGQEAEVSLSYLPDRKFKGRITYIYPTVDEKTRTAHVRMEFHNPGLFLKPGMFATVQVRVELEPSALLVPDSAVLRSGEKNTVFVALDGGKFEPRVVTLGPRAENNMYQALSGLKEGEPVVTSAQFMLDSESQLREAVQKMLEPAKESAPAPEHQHPVPKPAEMVKATTAAAPTSFVCPMPDHASIQYDHPGKCPICGMTLIPNTASQNAEPPSATPGSTAAPEEHSEHHH
jgi:RND family efflux transporter MFP subunit